MALHSKFVYMKNSNIKYQRGMSLIELMISMVILASIVSVAVPSMKSLFERKNITEVGKHFEKSIKLARNEAISRSAVIRIRPTSASSDWSKGWFLEYSKIEADGVTTTVEVIRTFPPIAGNPAFTSTTFNDSTLFEILPNGQAKTLGGFVLTYTTNCSAGVINYALLLSGILQKRITPCP